MVKKTEWLFKCGNSWKTCNDGICARFDEYFAQTKQINKAIEMMAEESEEIGAGLSVGAIRGRLKTLKVIADGDREKREKERLEREKRVSPNSKPKQTQNKPKTINLNTDNAEDVQSEHSTTNKKSQWPIGGTGDWLSTVKRYIAFLVKWHTEKQNPQKLTELADFLSESSKNIKQVAKKIERGK